MSRKRLGFFFVAFLVAIAAAVKVNHDQKEKERRERPPSQRLANLQPELSPPPPDEMWAQKSPTPSRRGLQMMERPDGTPIPQVTPSPSPSPSPNPNAAQIDPLMRDREQLLRQIWQLTPTLLDEQLTQRNRELQQLRTQLAQYSSALQDLNQQSNEAFQFRAILQQQTVVELDNRIRVQERLLASTRDEIARVNLNPQMYDPSTFTALQTQSAVQYQQLQSLLAQRSTISVQAMDAMQTLNQQMLTSRASLEAARAATLDQIRFIEQDIARLNSEKGNLQLLREQYQREANLIEQQLRELGADQRQLKTITFP